jgi:hypothetical protein
MLLSHSIVRTVALVIAQHKMQHFKLQSTTVAYLVRDCVFKIIVCSKAPLASSFPEIVLVIGTIKVGNWLSTSQTQV